MKTNTIKILLCFATAIILGITVAYAVNRVGDLNRDAAIIDACVDHPEASARSACPHRPVSKVEAKGLRDTADTTGSLGWLAAVVLIFGVGGVVYEFITDFQDDDDD